MRNDLNSILLEGKIVDSNDKKNTYNHFEFALEYFSNNNGIETRNRIRVVTDMESFIDRISTLGIIGTRVRVVGKIYSQELYRPAFIGAEHIEILPKSSKEKKIKKLQNVESIYELLCEIETGEYDDIEDLASYLPTWGPDIPYSEIEGRDDVYTYNEKHLLVAKENGEWTLERRGE